MGKVPPITLEQLCAWHRVLFVDEAPADAGRLRWRRPEGTWELVSADVEVGPLAAVLARSHVVARGAHPVHVRRDVRRACRRFDRALRLLGSRPASLEQGVEPAAVLYARLLRAQPFVHGNLRVAEIALQVALAQVGFAPAPIVDPTDCELPLAEALRRDSPPTYRPLVRLLVESVENPARLPMY